MNGTGEEHRNALMGKGWARRTVHVHGVTPSGDAVLEAVDDGPRAVRGRKLQGRSQMQPLKRKSTNAWTILRGNWNAKAVLGWRFTKVELSKRQERNAPAKKRPQVGRATAHRIPDPIQFPQIEGAPATPN